MIHHIGTFLLWLYILMSEGVAFFRYTDLHTVDLPALLERLPDNIFLARKRAEAERGDLSARTEWALETLKRQPSAGQDEVALTWLKESAEQGDTDALDFLIEAYEEGGLAPRNAGEVLRWSRLLAELEGGQAQYKLGLRLLLGAGIPEDLEEGVKWLTLAAEEGHDSAQVALAGFFWTGSGPLSQDLEKATFWYEKAAESGHLVGMRMLGLAYRDGKGREVNGVEAVRWLKEAAFQGDVKAKLFLGEACFYGLSVEADQETAFSWLLRAAEAGDAEAQFLVAQQFIEGRGTTKNPFAGVSYLFRSATSGFMEAQYLLGKLFTEGQYVSFSEEHARQWLQAAVDQGHEDARLLMDWLTFGVVVQVERL